MTFRPADPESSMARLVEGAATRFYRGLLVSYSRPFRGAHGAEAAGLFGEACRDNWSHRRLGALARRLLAALVTVPLGGMAERRTRRRDGTAGRAGSVSVLGGPGFWADLRYAVRSGSRRPALSAAIVGTLALGIGTNTAVFGVINAAELHPVPYVNARRAMVLEAVPTSGDPESPRAMWVRTWVAQASRSIERVEAQSSRFAVLTGSGSATRRMVAEVTPGYLQSIGTRPFLGRLITATDCLSGAPPVAVITQVLWRSEFGHRPDILRATITIDGVPHQIVGVASAIDADYPGLTIAVATALPDGSTLPVYTVVWLRPSVSLEAAQEEFAALAPLADGGAIVRPRLSPPNVSLRRITVFKATEFGMGIASLLLLAIAGVNVVNLLLAVGETRFTELAVRRALGASAQRLTRLLLVEIAVLTLSGAVIGLGLAWSIVRALTSLGAGVQLQTQLERVRLDPTVIGYTGGVALLITAAVGLGLALRGTRGPAAGLKESGTRSVSRLRGASSLLVAVETGLSAVLLAAAGLVGHSFLAMRFADRGFDADRVLSTKLELPADRYTTPASRALFLNAVLANVLQLPGVERAGIGYCATVPFDCMLVGQWSVVGSKADPISLTSAMSFVTPGYFSLMGIPLVQGGDFRGADLTHANSWLQPAVISRSLARRFWADGNAVGAILEIAAPSRVRRYRVIGVSGDVSVWGLMVRNCRNCDLQLYVPLVDARDPTDVLLRARPGAPLPIPELRAVLTRLDPNVPSDPQAAEDGLSEFVQLPRFTSALFAAFAGLAVLLVGVGISGVVFHSVARRTKELGLRLALGATLGGVRRLVIVQGLGPALVGLAIGLGAALVLTRYLRAVLYGLSPTDPITFVGTPLLLIVIVVSALCIPAWRATRVDPAHALRAD